MAKEPAALLWREHLVALGFKCISELGQQRVKIEQFSNVL